MMTFSTRATEDIRERCHRLRSPGHQSANIRQASRNTARLWSRIGRWCASAACAIVVFALSVQPSPAHADDEAGAEQLFNQARKLMKQERYEEACAKLEASEELDPAAGTIVNLAVCYRKLGKLASAWSRFRKAADIDKRTGNRKRARFARRAAAKLKKRLPSLVIQLADDSIEGIVVMRNGTVVDSVLFGESVYVDPGEHTIEVTADGYEPYSTTIEAFESELSTIEIPALEKIPEPVVEEKPDEPEPLVVPPIASDKGNPGSGRRTFGLVTSSLGVVSLGVGLGLGFSAKSTWDGAFDDGLCDVETLACDAEGQAQTDTARQRALLSTILVGAGAAVAVTGLIVYLTAPKKRKSKAVSVAPMAGNDAWGMALTGRF